MTQRHTSAATSVNMVPTLFKRVPEFGRKNLDIGGGKYDTASEWLKENHGCKNLVYDPYNRSEEHNDEALRQAHNLDSITISNVLNVIKERKWRDSVLNLAAQHADEDTQVYITVYEGDRSGKARQTSKGFQLHRKTEAYIKEVGRFFRKVERKGKLIIASDPR